ncbi:hypothetical protein H0H87_008040 [Tephrocybe sp. NHM501043]|nr:hypothetical protein H0H87_008040 [Tephrocybe sp. NHM501043]
MVSAPSSYVRYHRAANLPDNWIAIGDSVMKINPADGQGCSKATIGAMILNSLMHSIILDHVLNPFKGFSKRFFEAQKDKIEPFWSGNKLVDYAYAGTDPVPGEKLSDGTWLRWYLHGLNRASEYDIEISSALWHVGMMLAPSIDLFQPKFMIRVLRGSLHKKFF